MKMTNKKHIRNAVLGAVTADALGVPFEFKSRGTFSVTGMTGYGTHSQPAGTWSDDSSMMLATLVSFIKNDDIDYYDIATNFSDWYHNGKFTPHGRCFDIGNTTRRAIYKFDGGANPVLCGGTGTYDNGNGSLMRILPIAFIPHEEKDIDDLSSLTHGHETSKRACRIYINLIENLMKGMSKEEALDALVLPEGIFDNLKEIPSLPSSSISGSGYVVSTLNAAVWCFENTQSYKECVITAVELGEDTDTVAMVAGALAGIYYGTGGEKGIPEEWTDTLAKKEWLEEIIKDAENCCE